MGGQLQIADDSYLRLLEEADARGLHELIEANRTHLAPWLQWAAGQTFEDTFDFIRGTRSQARENEGFQTAIVTEKGIVGVIGYVSVDWGNRSTRVGYWLEGRQGRGTMTAAVRLLVDRVEIVVATGAARLSRRGDIAAVPTGRRSLSRLRQLLDAGGRLARSRMTGWPLRSSRFSTPSTSKPNLS